MQENLETHHFEGEIHYSDGIEEKISLSERFGLWLSFYPFKQEEYLTIVFYWLKELGIVSDNEDEIRASALQWALKRSSRSGRTAWQFAKDWAGQKNLK
jgi:predicted AAA+ superfamily ATPase